MGSCIGCCVCIVDGVCGCFGCDLVVEWVVVYEGCVVG